MDLKKSKIEEKLEGKGYRLIDETPPFRTYEKHKKRIIYHISAGKVLDSFRVGFFDEDDL
jgi:hypothetical protein